MKELSEGMSSVDIRGKRFPGLENSHCKGPEAGAYEEASVAGVERVRGRAEDELMDGWGQRKLTMWEPRATLRAFILSAVVALGGLLWSLG